MYYTSSRDDQEIELLIVRIGIHLETNLRIGFTMYCISREVSGHPAEASLIGLVVFGILAKRMFDV